jgi:O-acetyl-ADP-ribose deacetylase (regulator of RNase III)
MPGPVSDSYDPEFGTGSNAHDVAAAIRTMIERATKELGPELKNIVQVVQGRPGRRTTTTLSERDWRVIRLTRALETI